MSERKYLEIVAHYEACLERFGDTNLGADWPNAEDLERRYQVMLELVPRPDLREPVTLLDFGCGTAGLYEYMLTRGIHDLRYAGLDLSERFIALARRKFPSATFYCGDLLEDRLDLPSFDYVVMNGVFTIKRDLTFGEMRDYFERLLTRVWAQVRRGLAFNVMSAHVDWQREDLFHLPFDTLAPFLKTHLSRHFAIRSDYRLYEYTTYVYR